MEKAPLPGDDNGVLTADGQSNTEILDVTGNGSAVGTSMEPTRDAWASKIQYLLAQVGFSVGLGNVWRFPYLCHQNGGGAFLLLYVVLLVVVGVPLFFLELAAGQCIRQGSIGVWKHISSKLAGIGYSSCVVCFFVALYYNVIIAWSLFYLGSSFRYPLPWERCPEPINNQTVKECTNSSPTTYFWFRKALDITDSINETGELNYIMTSCLLGAWTIVCLAMIKGIKSSGKVMYFSSIFPYVVLLCFLIRGLMLDGALEGLSHMFYPKLEIWANVQVWRQAATQVFFALGLGFGSIIAYSSYNPPRNNCHRDAFIVSSINFFTSVLATLVVFAVLGFRAKTIAMDCVKRNLFAASHYQNAFFSWPDPNSTSVEQYRDWFQQNKNNGVVNLTDCSLEEEMNKGVEGTGLAFITFTQAMSLFPGSPFWSALFFLMLLNLGLSTMFGTIQGILTPLMDNFKRLRLHKTALTVCTCVIGFVIGLMFTQRCGNYFVTMFDDYSATLPLIIVVIFETFSVAWVYGADRFLDDIQKMLQWRPPVVYKYLWKYICLLAMVGLLGASLLQMFLKRPTYTAWNQGLGTEVVQEYPDWALAVLALLIVVASLPVPVGFFHSLLATKLGRDSEAGCSQELDVERRTYTKCSTSEPDSAPTHKALEGEDEDEEPPRNSFLALGTEHYKLLPQREEMENGEETTEV